MKIGDIIVESKPLRWFIINYASLLEKGAVPYVTKELKRFAKKLEIEFNENDTIDHLKQELEKYQNLVKEFKGLIKSKLGEKE